MRGAEQEYFSHDHGHYFPGGPGWSESSLQDVQDNPFPYGTPSAGLDAGELRRLADAIAAVSAEEIEECAAKVPAAWPVTDAELDALVAFLIYRREPVAERLRATAEAV
jgi:hypothetical protein